MLKPSESYYSELAEGYVLKALEYLPNTGGIGKTICDIKLQHIESVIMKNIIQKQFVVTWNTNSNSSGNLQQAKQRLMIETSDRSDNFFQTLNFIC